MRSRLGIAMIVLAVMLLGGMAWSYPTRFAPATGLVDLPTSDVAPVNSLELALDYTQLEEGDQKVWPARIVVGVSESTELGVGLTTLTDGESDHITSFAAKMALMEEPASNFGLGFGAAFLNGLDSEVLDVYAVASKEFPMAVDEAYRYQSGRARLRGHLGLMFTRISNSVSDHELQPFLGFDVTTPEGASFAAEFKWTDFGDDHAAAAIRYPISPSITLQAGVARALTVVEQNDYRFFVGFSYAFSPSGER